MMNTSKPPDFFVRDKGVGDIVTGGLSAKEIQTASAFLQQMTPINEWTFSSYHLKHVAEAYGKRYGLSGHVSNGALIAAAIALGFPVRPESWPSLNAVCGVSILDLRALKRGLIDEERACS